MDRKAQVRSVTISLLEENDIDYLTEEEPRVVF